MFTFDGYDTDKNGIQFVSRDNMLPFEFPKTEDGHVMVAESLDYEQKRQYTLDNV